MLTHLIPIQQKPVHQAPHYIDVVALLDLILDNSEVLSQTALTLCFYR